MLPRSDPMITTVPAVMLARTLPSGPTVTVCPGASMEPSRSPSTYKSWLLEIWPTILTDLPSLAIVGSWGNHRHHTRLKPPVLCAYAQLGSTLYDCVRLLCHGHFGDLNVLHRHAGQIRDGNLIFVPAPQGRILEQFSDFHQVLRSNQARLHGIRRIPELRALRPAVHHAARAGE